MYLGDYRAVVRTELGQKIFVDTRDVSIAPHLLLDGMWERWITEVIGPLMRGSLFVDVGANFGWYSLLASKMGARRIISVEPNRRLFELLGQTMSVNGIKSRLVNKAVVDSPEVAEVQLNYLNTDFGGGSVVPSGTKLAIQTVAAATLDDILSEAYEEEPQLRSALLVLKIDVEGYEPRVILGGQSTILQQRTVAFVEYHADPHNSARLAEMLDFFEQNGFQMALVNEEAQLVPMAREGLGALPDAAMLCFRKFVD